MKKRLSGTKKGFYRMLSMLIALMMTIAFVPVGSAMAEDATAITVSGTGDATTVGFEDTLQMVVTPVDSTVTWSVHDVNAAGEGLGTQNNATIDSSGLLSGLNAGYVSVTAATYAPADQTDSIMITVDPVATLSAVALEGGSGVAQGKTKITGLPFVPYTYHAAIGEAGAEQTPYSGEPFSAAVQDKYPINMTVDITGTSVVSAVAGDTISIVQVDVTTQTITGFWTKTVSDSDLGTNLPPVADSDAIQILVNEGETIADKIRPITDFFHDPELDTIHVSNVVVTGDSTIADASQYSDSSIYFNGKKIGKNTISFDLTDMGTGLTVHHTMPLEVVNPAPKYFDNEDLIPFSEGPIALYFGTQTNYYSPIVNAPDWINHIGSVEVNGETVTADVYSVNASVNFDGENYSEIVLDPGVLSTGSNHIIIKADDYMDVSFDIETFNSNEMYYIHTSMDTTSGGLTATAQIVANSEHYYNYRINEAASIVFQLMNGEVPVDMVSLTADGLSSSATYHAKFNIADAATNPDYSVKVFLVTGDNADSDNIGYNLATEASQDKLNDELNNLNY